MKKKITLITLGLMLMASVSAIAWDINKQSVREITVGSIKNSSGTTIGVSTTGSSITATGKVKGRVGVFTNVSATGIVSSGATVNIGGHIFRVTTSSLPNSPYTLKGI